MNSLQVKKYYLKKKQNYRSGIIEQAKFSDSPLRKALGRQMETIADQGKNK